MYISVLHGLFTPNDGSVQDSEVSTLIIFSSVPKPAEEVIRLAGMKSEGSVGGFSNADPNSGIPFTLKEGYRIDNRKVLMKSIG